MKSTTFTADDQALAKIREFVLAEAASVGVNQEVVGKVDLVVEELVINVVNYAYGKSSGEIEVRCGVKESKFILSISDNGPKFNPLDHGDPDTSSALEERPIGGLGIYLVKQLSSSQTYHREGDRNVLMIVFDLNS